MITWPLLRNTIRRNSTHNTFGMVRKHPNGSPKPHQGWDFHAPVGTPVYAIGDGEIIFVRNRGDYGLQLCQSFTFQNRVLYAFYAHLHSVFVSSHHPVTTDKLIALTGKSGNAHDQPAIEHHLHFEIRKHAHPGHGLAGRISPLAVFGICPLRQTVSGNQFIT